MSFILDALNKAEEQRRLGQTPGVGTLHVPVTQRRNIHWPWVAGVALAVNTVVAGYLLWPEPESSPVAASPAPETPPAVERVRIAPEPLPIAGARQVPAPEPDRMATPKRTPAPKREPRFKPVQPSVPVIAMATQLTQPPAAPPAAAIKQKPFVPPVHPPVTSATPPPAAKPARAATPPTVNELSPSMRNSLPSMAVNIHVFDPDFTRRFVLIDMKRYQEGDHIRGDLVLDEITRDGLILSHRGQQFQMSNKGSLP